MQRFRITIEYDGRPYVGWQRQTNGLGVQQAIEEALVELSGEETLVYGSGRTDAGVHALGQVAHFDLEKDLSAKSIRDGLNYHLKPNPISILVAEPVHADFHARFDAVERRYLYRILNRRSPPTFDSGLVWWVPSASLDADAMHDAAQAFIGQHDFTSFRATQCQSKSPVKTVEEITVRRMGEELEISVRAKSFLHHQVRNFVGTLRLVGEGKWTRRDVEQALAARDRSAAGPTAAPDGLYLESILFA